MSTTAAPPKTDKTNTKKKNKNKSKKTSKKVTLMTLGAGQVRMRLVHIDFWSLMKFFFLCAVVLSVVTIVSMLVLFAVLESKGVIGYGDELISSMTDGHARLSDVVSLPQVLSFAAVAALLNLIVVTALGAVVAGIYNFIVKVFGGPGVRFSAP